MKFTPTRIFSLILILVLSVIISSKNFYRTPLTEKKNIHQLHIVATTGMIGDALCHIVQDKATITTLMGPGVDPHSYESTIADIKKLNKADLIFYNGLYLEGRSMQSVFKNLSKTRLVYAVANALSKEDVQQDTNFSSGQDPHIWGDVQLWKKVVVYISKKIQEKDPTNASFYAENTATYLAALEELHQSILKAIQTIPPRQRVLITAHDAFGYFGKAYGLEVKALQGFSTVSEPDVKNRMYLKDFIIKRNIKTIFPEATVSNKSILALIESCDMEGYKVHTKGVLYSDSIGEKDTQAGSYIGMMKENVDNIVEGLTQK